MRTVSPFRFTIPFFSSNLTRLSPYVKSYLRAEYKTRAWGTTNRQRIIRDSRISSDIDLYITCSSEVRPIELGVALSDYHWHFDSRAGYVRAGHIYTRKVCTAIIRANLPFRLSINNRDARRATAGITACVSDISQASQIFTNCRRLPPIIGVAREPLYSPSFAQSNVSPTVRHWN